MRRVSLLLLVPIVACGPAVAPVPQTPPLASVPSAPGATATARGQRVVLSIVGTNDVHGHLETLPYFAGYVANLRAARREDGAVVLIDGGDMWQGTIASNMAEGAPLVAAYNLLGYDAATIGNHEFDYGPIGDAATPQRPTDNRRGALLARVSEAEFSVLGANFLDAESGNPVQWPGVQRSVLLERSGVKIGVIGVSTFETPATTIAANVSDMRMAPLAPTIAALAAELRGRGAQVVIVAAHAGAECESFDNADDLSTCNEDEIVEVAQSLPAGAVDIIVAGHTHKAIAHRVNGVAIIESYALGRAFGRVDLVVESGRVVEQRIFPPRDICEAADEGCPMGAYEGAPVEIDTAMSQLVAEPLERANALRNEELGVTLTDAFERNYRNESALGNLLADFMRRIRPNADVAILNSGGVRANIEAGPLTYGELYETFPFDNRFATVRLTGEQLKQIIAFNMQRDGGTLIFSGLRVTVACRGEHLRVSLRDSHGRRVRPDRVLTVVTSDYLATTPLFSQLPAGAVSIEGEVMREAIAEHLRQRGGTLASIGAYDTTRPRVRLPMPRPVVCGASN